MPKSFSPEERTLIRDALLQTGKELFNTFGLQKTTVQDITDRVQIAKGSFYTFFDSKEALYYEIYRREEKKLRGKVLMALYGQEFSPTAFRDFLLEAFHRIDEYPIIRRMYLEDEYQQVARKLSPAYLDEHTSEDISALTPLIREWQAAGRMIQKEPEVITSAIRAFFTLILHKKDLGAQYFEDTIEFMAECLAEKLIIEKGQSHD